MHERRRGRGPNKVAPNSRSLIASGPSASLPAESSLERRFLNLQREAGNAAVSGLLASIPVRTAPPAAIERLMIQRTVSTSGGEWDTDEYKESTKGTGALMKLAFVPKHPTLSPKIGLIQTIERMEEMGEGGLKNVGKARFERLRKGQIPEGGAEHVKAERTTAGGWSIDRVWQAANPIYGAPEVPKGKGIEETPMGEFQPEENPETGRYQLGSRIVKKGSFFSKGGEKTRPAKLMDEPIFEGKATGRMTFHVTALSLKGPQAGGYYGAVKWGFEAKDGETKRMPLEVVSAGTASPELLEAAAAWNQSRTKEGTAVPQIPER